MTQYTVNGQDIEKSSQDIDVQAEKLDTQNFNRKTSLAPTKSGGITLSDDRLAVIMYLRKHYLELGPPIDPQLLARELDKKFFIQGGYKYLRLLFACGPVTQGSSLANLRIPEKATDNSLGICY
jgi:sulfur relay (sulfurtransferase) DsrC/TusE family protein